MAGWGDIGAALTGNTAGNELAYQKGLSLGANTQNAMQQARERVRQNTAMEQLPSLADQLGIPAAFVTAIQAGVNPTEIANTAKTRQEVDLRGRASDPNATPEQANIALRGVASAPVERYYAVGKGYGDKFADAGVVPQPRIPGEVGGGASAQMQILTALGLVDDNGQITNPELAMDITREMSRQTDLGGVPGEVDLNPYRRRHAVPPTAAPAPGGIAADLAPPMPSAVPPMLPPAAAPAAPTAVARPTSSAATVGANVAEIERSKVVGKQTGENQMAAPSALADIDKLTGNVQSFLQAPGFSSVYGNVQGRAPVQTAMGLLSQDSADAQAALKNIDAQTFGIAIQKMRGLGQLSNAEGLKVTDAFSRATNPTLSEPEARKAWAEVLTGLQTARTRVLTGTSLPAEGAAPGGAPAGAPAMYADPAKEARYQAWKAQQGAR